MCLLYKLISVYQWNSNLSFLEYVYINQHAAFNCWIWPCIPLGALKIGVFDVVDYIFVLEYFTYNFCIILVFILPHNRILTWLYLLYATYMLFRYNKS